jgi:hypothetical protein
MKRLLVLIALIVVPVLQTSPLIMSAHAATVAKSALGDLSPFEKIASDALALANKGDLGAAQKRITDFETAWDAAQHRLYALNHDQWSRIDEASDAAIKSLRAAKPSADQAKMKLAALVASLNNPAGK